MGIEIVKHFSRSALTRVVTFVDLAVSTKTSADYTSIATVGTTAEADLIVLNVVHGRWEWPEARSIIVTEVLRQGVRLLGVEQVAFQLAAIQELSRLPELVGVAVKGVTVDRDKVSRALPVAARAEAGQLYLVRGPWNESLIQQFEQFPTGPHDDDVDAVSGAVGYLSARYGVTQRPATEYPL